MPWIKKNLTLVAGAVVSLLLLGAAAWFWHTQGQRVQEVGAQLEAKNAEWNDLVGRKPYPSDPNIEAVRAEEKELQKLREVLKVNFQPISGAPVNDALELKVLIETAIANLQDEAGSAGVALPDPEYAFTFKNLRPMAPSQYDSNSIPTLAEQVAQVSTLARALYTARIHSLEAIRRPAILKNEGGTADHLAVKPSSDDLVTRMPMEVTFRSFSGELAGVIAGLAGLSNTVVIKKISIEPTTIAAVPSSPPPVMMPYPRPTAEAPTLPEGRTDPYARLRGAGRPGGMDPGMASRYGLGPAARTGPGGMDPALAARYGLIPQPGAPAPAATPVGPGVPATPAVVVDEKPLRTTLQLDFIKLKPAPAAARRAV